MEDPKEPYRLLYSYIFFFHFDSNILRQSFSSAETEVSFEYIFQKIVEYSRVYIMWIGNLQFRSNYSSFALYSSTIIIALEELTATWSHKLCHDISNCCSSIIIKHYLKNLSWETKLVKSNMAALLTSIQFQFDEKSKVITKYRKLCWINEFRWFK